MNAAMITALIRHMLTALAGGMAVRYGVDGGTLDVIISGVAAAGGLGWSLWNKR